MCDWCKKNAPLLPMEAGVKMPMICSECGTFAGYYDWKQIRSLLSLLSTLKKEKEETNVSEN